jgi:DNA polymerase V
MHTIVALVDCNNFYVSCERCFSAAIQDKPVIVLSNNDSCVVARSNEVKPFIKIGTPVFQCRDLIIKHHVVVFSSNYALYADMSDRVMKSLAPFSPQVEIFSIDEAFLDLSRVEQVRLTSFGHDIRRTVLTRVGIPVSVGIASTKTLSKIAAEIVKKYPEYKGVLALAYLSEQEIDTFLSCISIEDVWGIGPRYAHFLHEHGMITAKHLKYANTHWIRKHLTVVGERTVLELRGIACLPIEQKAKPKQGIMSSKSFGRPIESLTELEEAVASYTTRAAEKLRKQGSVAASISVFIHTNHFHKELPQYANSAVQSILFPTAFTPELIGYALALLRSIYKQGYQYKKAGVYLTRIMPQEHIQFDLFGDFSLWQYDKRRRLMEAVDRINMLWGHDTLFFGAQGMTRAWQMRQEKRSPRYTTRWNEIFSVT